MRWRSRRRDEAGRPGGEGVGRHCGLLAVDWTLRTATVAHLELARCVHRRWDPPSGQPAVRNQPRSVPFACRGSHLVVVVALAGGRPGRHCALDRGELVGRKVHLDGAERLCQALARARTNQGHHPLAAGEHPGDATCATVAAVSAAIARSASTRARLRLRFSPLKRGAWPRKSAGPVSRPRLQRLAELDLRPADRVLAALARDRGGDPAHLRGAQDRRHRLTAFSHAGCVRRVGAPDRLGPDLGEPDVSELPGCHHLADRADRLLDRYLGL